MTDETIRQYIEFIEAAERLKSTLRSAHTAAGRRESAAEHSWRLALLALALEDELEGLNRHQVLKLCLVHDLGEAVGGDVPAVEQVPGEDKSARERADMATLTSPLPVKVRDEIMALWEEYEAGHTPEARLVKGLDKLETLIQHNQGANPPDFDYEFNLGYGRAQMSGHPLLPRLRRRVDEVTARRAEKQKDGRD